MGREREGGRGRNKGREGWVDFSLFSLVTLAKGLSILLLFQRTNFI